MADATYSGDPAASDRDWVRFVVQDTDTSNADLLDTEIDAMLDEKSSKLEAAVACQQMICQKFILVAMRASEPSMTIREIEAMCEKRVRTIRKQFGGTGNPVVVSPYLPSRSIADKEAALDDEDRVPPRFSRDQNSLVPGTISSDEDVTV